MAIFWWDPTNGDDGNDGTSKANAKKTLQLAIGLPTTPGDRLIVASGDHTGIGGNTFWDDGAVSGSDAALITLEGEEADNEPILRFTEDFPLLRRDRDGNTKEGSVDSIGAYDSDRDRTRITTTGVTWLKWDSGKVKFMTSGTEFYIWQYVADDIIEVEGDASAEDPAQTLRHIQGRNTHYWKMKNLILAPALAAFGGQLLARGGRGWQFENIQFEGLDRTKGIPFSVNGAFEELWTNCKAHTFNVGCRLEKSDDVRLVDFVAHNCVQDGIVTINNLSKTVIDRPLIYDCDDSGLDLAGWVEVNDAVLRDFTASNGSHAVKLWESQNVTPGAEIKLFRCRIYNSRAAAIVVSTRTAGSNGGALADALALIDQCTIAKVKQGLNVNTGHATFKPRARIRNSSISHCQDMGDGGTIRAIQVEATATELDEEQYNLLHVKDQGPTTPVVNYKGTDYTATQVVSNSDPGDWGFDNGGVYGTGTKSEDPQYESYDGGAYADQNFTPKDGSPLVDAALVVAGVNDDVADGKPDMGAYELAQAAAGSGLHKANRGTAAIIAAVNARRRRK